MTGESPLSMMRTAPARRRAPGRAARRLRRLFAPLAIVIVLALGWSWLWYYAASIAGARRNGWIEREAALGRVYACGSQDRRLSVQHREPLHRCRGRFNNNRPPFDVRATGVTFSAQVFRPTLLNGEITGPVTLANPGEAPIFVANWTRARLSLLGLPPEPERIAVSLQEPRLDRVSGPASGMIFKADSVEFDGRIVQGSASNNPVIEATGHFEGAIAPTFHPLLARRCRAISMR